jgi:hypothetical protein
MAHSSVKRSTPTSFQKHLRLLIKIRPTDHLERCLPELILCVDVDLRVLQEGVQLIRSSKGSGRVERATLLTVL